MDRCEVIQRLLDLHPAPSYLEIGVDQGATFHAVRADRKTGVDPRFAFDLAAAQANPANVNCEYVQCSSDEYFAGLSGRRDLFDLIFIDGLHTFEQTTRDLLNAIQVVKPDGLIIIDDVIPSTYAASIPDLELSRRFWAATANPDGSWMGDVYKVVFFVEQFLPTFSFATLRENHGQTILWRKPRAVPQQGKRSMEAISRLDYIDVVMSADRYNIKPVEEIFREINQDTGSHRFGL